MDDIIYRQDAIEATCRGCSGDFYQECQAYHGKKTFCDQIKRLRAVPSIQGYADIAYMEKMSDLIFDSAFEMGKAFAQQWIPVSERLPEESLWTRGGKQFSNSVLMTVYDKSDENTRVDYGHTMDGEWYSETENQYIECIADWKVIAWMPLPEPWKGERES